MFVSTISEGDCESAETCLGGTGPANRSAGEFGTPLSPTTPFIPIFIENTAYVCRHIRTYVLYIYNVAAGSVNEPKH